MIALPVPAASAAYFDQQWDGAKHVNRCARMQNGVLVVKLPRTETPFIVYESLETATLARNDNGTLTIEVDRPNFTGRICYGYRVE